MRRMILLVVFLVAPVLAEAAPGTLMPPTLKEGQFVYTIPEGFDPKGIGQAGLQQIQGVAANLHHPFYVVVVDKLPSLTGDQRSDARSKGYTESGDELKASYAIDRLAEEWADKYPDTYDTAHASVFLLSYDPRQYRILAGTDWKTRLGLEKQRLKPFEEPFLRKVTGTPKDPRGGIIDLITQFDEHVFDQTDPERVAARAEAERRKAEAERIKGARGALDAQILALTDLLDAKPEYLPDDLDSSKALLAKGKEVRQRDKPDEMLAFAGEMAPAVGVLDKFVSQKRNAALLGIFKMGVSILTVMFGIFTLIFVLALRRRKYLALRSSFNKRIDEWRQKVKNAARRYVDSYGGRDDIVAMDDTTGKTRVLWDKVTAELDDIWVVVRAIEDRVEYCARIASKASFFNFGPLVKAEILLDGEFEFDTGKVDKSELFGKETQHVNLQPTRSQEALEERFRAVQNGWDRLQEAADARLKDARQQFPHGGMDRIERMAEEHGIPALWYGDHPLAGNEESDLTTWKQADDLRWSDPVAYLDLIQSLREKEREVENRITALSQMIQELDGVRRMVVVPDLQTVVNADDDPNVTLVAAQQADHSFRGSLASCAAAQDPRQVGDRHERAVLLYKKVLDQTATLKSAIKSAENDVDALAHWDDLTQLSRTMLAEALSKAVRVHSHISEAANAEKAFADLLTQAHKVQSEARVLLAEGKHLSASRKAAEAAGLYRKAETTNRSAMAFLMSLDDAKAAFEQRLAKVPDLLGEATQKIRRHEGNLRALQAFQAPALKKVNHYPELLENLDAQIRGWDQAGQKAKRDYEAEQERKRQEKERRRREERRRRDE